MDNQITDAANDYLLERMDGKQNPDSPFYNDGDELYLKFDSIKIRNAGTINVEVGYYWRGVKMCIFPVPNVQIDYLTLPSAAKHIGLKGIAGAMKMVLT